MTNPHDGSCSRQFIQRKPLTFVPWLSLVVAMLGSSAFHGFSVMASGIHLSNTRRTGYQTEAFAPPYRLAWTYKAIHKPRPAWKEPAWETQRIDFDYAYAVSSGDGLVFVASSSDHALYALDQKTGTRRWRFFTEGPVRLAPAVADDKVYFSSDDGRVYCLNAATGSLVWTHRPEIPDERLIGNDQMVSRWPARSGVLVADGKAYTTFGMWSPEGIVVTCLDARTGAVIWRNDSSGTKYATQPHYEAMGGVSPQGYLALCGDVLVVPCGRATPAFFDRRTGRLIYDESEGLFPGGAWTMTFDNLAFTPCEYLKKPNPERPAKREADICDEASLVAIRAADGEEVFHLNGVLKGVIDNDGRMSLIGPGKLVGIDLQDVLEAAPDAYVAKMGSSEGHMVNAAKYQRWTTPTERIYSIIQAGSTLITGGRGMLVCYDAIDGHRLWETKVAGSIRDLLLEDDALLVSTTEGEIHCFHSGPFSDAARVNAVRSTDAVSAVTASDADRKTVRDLLTVADASEGYGLVLGETNAEFLAELAKNTEMTWHWAAGEREVTPIREKLADAGLYGTRIAIQNVGANPLPYADYSTNLLIWTVTSASQLQRVSAGEVHRVLRPYDGTAVIACSAELHGNVNRWLASSGIPQTEIQEIPLGIRIQRGPLPGAGAWTHQYADVGKSSASRDKNVRLPLKVLWFGSLGPADIVSRHYRAPVPLAIDGQLYVTGMDNIHAVDAYTGRILWERHFPGVGRWPAAYRGGCSAADSDAVYVLQQSSCLRLDRRTGRTRFTYSLPRPIWNALNANTQGDDETIWEYLAVTPDTIVGTLGQPHIRRSWWSMAHPSNHVLFALDKATGKLKWKYEPQNAIDSNAIAIEGNRVFLIDGLAPVDTFARARRAPGTPAAKQARKPPKKIFSLPGSSKPRVLLALDLQTGKTLWTTRDIGARQNFLSVANGVLLSTVPIWHGYQAKQEAPGLTAFSSQDGHVLWTRKEHASYPTIVGDVIFLPDAFELKTGKPVLRPDPLTGERLPFAASVAGGCGRLAGCDGALMKRSGSMGFFDLSGLSGVYHFPNMRASCWINMIPACGLVLVPEGSSSCPCAYNYKTSIALMPDRRQNYWGLYTGSRRSKAARIRQLRLNLGAPGDKQDTSGQIWFAYPRPSTTGPRGAGGMGQVPFDRLPIEIDGDGTEWTSLRHNPDWLDIKTDKPWLHGTALAGRFKLRIRLAPENTQPASYQVKVTGVRLEDAASDDGVTVTLKGIGSAISDHVNPTDNKTVMKIFTVDVADVLELEVRSPDAGSAASITGIEIAETRSRTGS